MSISVRFTASGLQYALTIWVRNEKEKTLSSTTLSNLEQLSKYLNRSIAPLRGPLTSCSSSVWHRTVMYAVSLNEWESQPAQRVSVFTGHIMVSGSVPRAMQMKVSRVRRTHSSLSTDVTRPRSFWPMSESSAHTHNKHSLKSTLNCTVKQEFDV